MVPLTPEMLVVDMQRDMIGDTVQGVLPRGCVFVLLIGAQSDAGVSSDAAMISNMERDSAFEMLRTIAAQELASRPPQCAN